jgi:undecaprenyl diphosphate synthase
MHVAIIMDGNGVWAEQRGLPHAAGQSAGARAVRAVVESGASLGVDTLTLYALSAGDWSRSLFDAIDGLGQSTRIDLIGRSGGRAEHHSSAADSPMQVRIVLDYSSHDAIAQSALRAEHGLEPGSLDFYRRLKELDPSALPAGAVDVLIRTGGSRQLSDFMLWETAYATLYRSDLQWPDFDAQELRRALGNLR